MTGKTRMSAATIKREQTGANEGRAYRQTIGEVLTALGTDARRGLSEAEARARLERFGKNELAAEKPAPQWRKRACTATSSSSPAND